MTVTEASIRDALRAVVDPEVGVDIVDLGLVYDVALSADEVRVRLTMTSPACPMGQLLADEAAEAARSAAPNARSVVVELVWDPPWSPTMMSPAARARLGWEH